MLVLVASGGFPARSRGIPNSSFPLLGAVLPHLRETLGQNSKMLAVDRLRKSLYRSRLGDCPRVGLIEFCPNESCLPNQSCGKTLRCCSTRLCAAEYCYSAGQLGLLEPSSNGVFHAAYLVAATKNEGLSASKVKRSSWSVPRAMFNIHSCTLSLCDRSAWRSSVR